MLNEPRQRVTTYLGTGQVVTTPGQVVTCMIGHWYALNVLYHIYIYNSILIWVLTILKSGARTPRTVTKFAVKTAIDLTQTI